MSIPGLLIIDYSLLISLPIQYNNFYQQTILKKTNMAHSNNSIITGKLTGSIGKELVFREWEGKTIVGWPATGQWRPLQAGRPVRAD